MKYQKIHIWEFPLDKTFVSLEDNFRDELFSQLLKGRTYQKVADLLNEKSIFYRQKTHLNNGHIWTWKQGYKIDRRRKSKVNIPLWALIEISKIMSFKNEKLLLKIEKNIKSYTGWGKTKYINNPKLPILLTPEMTSVIFNLCGDGHIGKREECSSYRQITKEALECFTKKLQNVFGDFDVVISENSKLMIPKTLTDFYVFYFKLNNLNWNVARIPDKIKNMDKEFLIAGLSSFIIDEGHISDTIEIYSKNKELLSDINEIAIKLGYKTYGPKAKYKKNGLDSYRLYISVKDAIKLHNDILTVSKKFPTCKLAHKMTKLEKIIRRQSKNSFRTPDKYTKTKILELIEKEPKTISQLSSSLNIADSTIREHVDKLEKGKLIKKTRPEKKHYILISKII